MKISEIKAILNANPDKTLSFALPDGELIPSHFHITEVGYISKNFIDCGGTKRHLSTCQLQIWLGTDLSHRLTSGKAAAILDLGGAVLPAGDLEMEIEYEQCSVSQYLVTASRIVSGVVLLSLSSKHTDCLAKETCGVGDLEESCCGPEASAKS